MSIEETVVLGQFPGTDFQPTYIFWFTVAGSIVALWILLELLFRIHRMTHKTRLAHTAPSTNTMYHNS
ncbi:hypothetical protein CSA80_00100 [Candidatus Saccharibacteria bacterium]|nr:MAG: hypothetical protein CSA80_00100 [Candidatus Saccharibacteria bacterium]